MEHSVRGYLEKLSTPKLESILQYYLQEQHQSEYEYAIKEILRILESRKEQ